MRFAMSVSALPLVVAVGGLVSTAPAQAQVVAPAVPEPLFSRHLVPLLGRLGCNSGACHGAVQGQNGEKRMKI